MSSYQSMLVEEVFTELNTSERGLNTKEAEERLVVYGTNIIRTEKRFKIIKMILHQFNNFLVFLLIAAGTISLILSMNSEHSEGLIDAIVIFTVIIINAVIGFIQEYKSDQALEKLKDYFKYNSTVLRDGIETLVETNQLVPGDIILLEVGDRIPADVRLFEIKNLKIDEAMLTGESEAVLKKHVLVQKDASIHNQHNMAFMGTTVVYGRGKGIVVKTGMNTETGKIAQSLRIRKESTPLQKRLAKLGRVMGVTIIALVIVVFLAEWIGEEHFEWFESFKVAISLAVSAVPEGLPTAIVVTLAIGVNRMAKRKALISRMPAVETLGSVDFILSDKTGTVTKNEQTVKKICDCNKIFDVEGSGYDPEGNILYEGQVIKHSDYQSLQKIIEVAAHCNNSTVNVIDGNISIVGDPTEAALKVLSQKAGIEVLKERIDEIFFDSDRKRMTTIHKLNEKEAIVYMKGSPLIVLAHCSKTYEEEKEVVLTRELKSKIDSFNLEFAKDALRVLGTAFKLVPLQETYTEAIESDMTFLGLVGMIDPARPEVKDSITKCRNAGITPIMVTGDQPTTAKAIANEIGLITAERPKVITGGQLKEMSDTTLEKELDKVSIFARMSPSDKLRVVEMLQKKGHVVAVTGDGVNDAPSLKKADIGVGMGITGTDVTKEVSDMVLTDDNFATLVDGIEEGRGIYKNMLSFLKFLIGANFDEIATVFIVTVFFGLQSPLLAIHILWLNIITDGLPAMSLAFDPYDPKELMSKPPRRMSFLRDVYVFAAIAGFFAFLSTAGIFLLSYYVLHEGDVTHARTTAFTITLLFELVIVWFARSDFLEPLKRRNPFTNKFLVISIVIGLLLQFAILYIPQLHQIFHVTAITLADWGIIVGLIAVSIILFIATKYGLVYLIKRRARITHT